MIKVLVVGQTPPPYGGQAVMIGRLLDSPPDGVRFYHVRMAFSRSMGEIGRAGLGKIVHLAAVILRILWCRVVHGTTVLYFPPGGPDRVPMYRDLAILLATRWMFSRTVFHFHAGGLSELYPQLSAPLAWLFRRAYYGADAGIRLSPLSPPDPELLRARREYIIPNGIDDPTEGALYAADHDSKLCLLFVGVLRESKGVLTLIDALAALHERGIAFEAELVGEMASPEFEAELRRRLDASGIAALVRLPGVLVGSEKWAAYRRANVFVLPTHFEAESFPLVIMEAMAFGLPTVASQWRGIPSLVIDRETGLLSTPRDPSSVADRLAELAAQPALRKALGEAARQRFLAEYLWQRHLDRMALMFHDVAGAPRRQPAPKARAADCAPGGIP